MVFHKKSPAFNLPMTILVVVFTTLLLVPSIGIIGKPYGKIGVPSASAQLSTQGNENNTERGNMSSAQNASISGLLFRGLVGSMISSTNATADGGQEATHVDYTVTGRWRMFVNDSIVQRFVANLTVARIDGSQYYNIFIENVGRESQFSGNSANIMAQVFADSNLPSATFPMKLEINGKVLRIPQIDIGQRTMENDLKQQSSLRLIAGQPIYGIVEFQGPG
jgi:hypothetical protein